jgi:hypothetical protein
MNTSRQLQTLEMKSEELLKHVDCTCILKTGDHGYGRMLLGKCISYGNGGEVEEITRGFRGIS